jgi:hypothetical protein
MAASATGLETERLFHVPAMLVFLATLAMTLHWTMMKARTNQINAMSSSILFLSFALV